MIRAATQRLQLAFKIAERDVAALDEKGLAAAVADVGQFLRAASRSDPGAETGGVWVGSQLPRDVSKRDIVALCAAARAIVDAVLLGVSLPPFDAPRATIALSPIAVGKRVIITVVDGSITDRFVLA